MRSGSEDADGHNVRIREHQGLLLETINVVQADGACRKAKKREEDATSPEVRQLAFVSIDIDSFKIGRDVTDFNELGGDSDAT